MSVITSPVTRCQKCNATRDVRSIPQENRRIDSQTEGRISFSTMLDGTSNRQYGGKNRVTAVLYCRPVRLRSVLSPAILALPLGSSVSAKVEHEIQNRCLHVAPVDEGNQVQHLDLCSATPKQDGSMSHHHLRPKAAPVLCRPCVKLSCLQQESSRQ